MKDDGDNQFVRPEMMVPEKGNVKASVVVSTLHCTAVFLFPSFRNPKSRIITKYLIDSPSSLSLVWADCLAWFLVADPN